MIYLTIVKILVHVAVLPKKMQGRKLHFVLLDRA
jgi:hypothetical protein